MLDWISIGFSVVFMIICFGLFWIFLSHYRKAEDKTNIQLAFIIFFLCSGIARIILVYFDYFLTQLNPAEYVNFVLYWKIALIFQFVGIGSIIFVAEKGVFNGKDLYIFLIGYSVLFGIGIFQSDIYLTLDFVFFSLYFAIFIPISYLYLAYKFPQSRKNIALIFVGFIIFGMAVLMVSPDVLALFPGLIHEVYLVSAMIQIPGYVIFALGVKRMYFS